MAGHQVTASHIHQVRLYLGAVFRGSGTARVENAPWRWIRGIGYPAGQDDSLLAQLAIQ